LRGFRIVLFLAELHHLAIWSTDIGNAHLEAYTLEKVVIIAGPRLGSVKATSSSLARHYMDYEVVVLDGMTDLLILFAKIGFFPCKAKPDIWMRKKGNEYIAVFIDDLAIAVKDPKELVKIMEK
jgi:hypothetical protein